jgi:LuxR family maltose regulon positive regulatory protein
MQLEVREGQLQKAAELYQQARHQGTLKGSILLGPVGFACVQMGEVLREWNHLEQAKQTLLEGMKLCQQQTGMPEYVLEGQINLARTMLASGYKQHAAETMQQVEALIAELLGRGGNVLPIISMALAYRLRFWLAQGSFNSADQWLAANGINADADISSVNEEFYILLIRVLIHQDRLQGVEKLLQQLLEAVGKIRSKVEILILHALLFQAQGNRGQAVTVLTRALRLAEPEGYLRLFVDQDKAIIPLLEQVAGRVTARANIEPILAVIAEQPHLEDRVAVIALPPESKMLLEPLKDQEIRILRLMAAGLSNREIADELYLSVNTVKVYASRIYNKLGVHKRGEAVAQAQELGLI